MSKYHSKKVYAQGQTFDSMKEYRRWNDLCLLQRAGTVSHLQRQVKFVLIPAQYGPVDGRRKLLERECAYYADFVYQEHGQTVVEDCKGFRTPEYKIKRKLMLHKYGVRIRET